jgi:hypothetical protein
VLLVQFGTVVLRQCVRDTHPFPDPCARPIRRSSRD